MVDLKQLQKRVLENKKKHWFNTTEIMPEILLLYWEVAEFTEAWWKKLDNMPEELADIAIYLLWIAEILWIDLEQEILRKMEINEKRVYKKVNWVRVKDEWQN